MHRRKIPLDGRTRPAYYRTVTVRSHTDHSAQPDVEALLPLALSRPREASERARAVLAAHPGPYEASMAHQAAGIVLREFGDVAASVRELRRALRCARRSGSAEREVDVLSTLAVALVYAGRTTDGLAAFEQAAQRSGGVLAARVRLRRAATLWSIGQYPAALEDLRHAVPALIRAGDTLWTARAINTRGLVYDSTGHADRADADFVEAGRLFAETSQEFEAIYTVLNRGLVAFASGDLPAALSILDEASSRYRPIGVPVPALSIDRCAVLIAAGLFRDALAEADAAVRESEQVRGRVPKRAELLLMAANCALAATEPRLAIDWAEGARRLFRSQHSAWWKAQAVLVIGQARHATGEASPALLREANRAAVQMEALGAGQAVRAHLLAGRVALALGRRGEADRHFAAAARHRRRGPALTRASAWLGAALRAAAAGDSQALFAACRRGLEVMEESWLSFGASELRAQATAHGAELAALAQRQAAQGRNPRLLLAWSERWRATALAVPAVRPVADPGLHADLTALRQVTRSLGSPQRQRSMTATLGREQLRLERAIRSRALRAHRSPDSGRAVVGVADLLDELGSSRLIQIIEIDDDIHVLVCGGGRVRHLVAGRIGDAARRANFARFALRRIARCGPADDPASALAILETTGPALQEELLGPAVRYLGSGPVVIVPPGRLHTIPWALLPALADRDVSVAPSATAWVRAHTTPAPQRRRVVLARGPGLVSEGAEIPAVAPLYDDVTVLAGDDATAGHVLGALDGAWLAHIAAHGNFRADSPLFSSLRMCDGPLTVYDFEQLRRAPYLLVLSSCDSGVVAPVGADELLGLVSSLLPLGTTGIIAGVVPLNDDAIVPVMTDLHRHLRAGQSLPGALRAARRAAETDPVRQATAVSLVALGSG
jgi:tetratricopeptide (TPR) repeat protein